MTAERFRFERFYAQAIEVMIGIVIVLICASSVNLIRHENLRTVLVAGHDTFAALAAILFVNGLLRRFSRDDT
jgi:ascorbate-specific PTS system EIIC-type component UlaA